jgi:hypothetical protein
MHKFKPKSKEQDYEHRVGDLGESIVKSRLAQLSSDFTVNHDVSYGGSQIDHIVVNPYSHQVFVIETKYWGGHIERSSNDKEWIQNKNGSIRYLPNPIKQNQYHCRMVKRVYTSFEVINIVVFVRNKDVPKSKCIVSENELVSYINKLAS